LPSKLPEDSVGSALVRSPTLEYIIGEDATDDLNEQEGGSDLKVKQLFIPFLHGDLAWTSLTFASNASQLFKRRLAKESKN
jgi:hypothetical protein